MIVSGDSEWISVEDRVPEDYTYDYLVVIDDGDVYIDCTWADAAVWEAWNVTHWMPVPELPEVFQ